MFAARCQCDDLKALEIPLPPLAEQRRIAEVLDRAEALRAKRRAALAQLDSLTQSLFLDLFGDPAINRERHGRHVTACALSLVRFTTDGIDSEMPRLADHCDEGVLECLRWISATESVDQTNAHSIITGRLSTTYETEPSEAGDIV